MTCPEVKRNGRCARPEASRAAPSPYGAPMACRFSELVVDSRDPEALAAFWAAVLDYRVLSREDGAVEIGPAEGFGGAAPTLVFAPVPNPTPGKVRLHIDLNPT